MIGVGIDPGEEGGIAVVSLSGSVARPRLVRAERFYGSSFVPWFRRVCVALNTIRPALPASPADLRVLLEEVPTGFGTVATAAGLGMRRGAIYGALVARGIGPVEGVEWREWARGVGVRAGKTMGGLHRLDEAAHLIDGAGPRLDALELERPVGVVDVAEAMLIALAAARGVRG